MAPVRGIYRSGRSTATVVQCGPAKGVVDLDVARDAPSNRGPVPAPSLYSSGSCSTPGSVIT